MCGTLHAICDMGLRNRLEAEASYQDMIKTKRYCAMQLLGLVRKICNGSTYVVVDDVVGSLIESLHNALLIRGDDFNSLPKYLEVSEHRYAVLDGAGFEIANAKFRDSYMEEQINRGQDLSKTYLVLKGWKEEAVYGTMDREIAAGKKALTDVFRARLCIRRSGGMHEQFRRDFSNGYISRSREQPMDLVEANRQMEHYKPILTSRRKTGEAAGSQHLLEGDKDKFVCFRCERCKPECSGARHCAFDKKADRSSVNSLERIAAKYQDLKAEIKRKKGGGVVDGSAHVTQGEVVPACYELIVQ